MRHWVCSDCGAVHDRNIYSARNILCVGLERQALVGEILAFSAGKTLMKLRGSLGGRGAGLDPSAKDLALLKSHFGQIAGRHGV
jgi:hypothetical protein